MSLETTRRARRVVGAVSFVVALALGGFANADVGRDASRHESSMRTRRESQEPARRDSARSERRESPEPARRESLEPVSDPWRSERHPVWLKSENDEEPPILVYPPRDPADPGRPVVLLHGMCGHPQNECPWFAGPKTENRYLACPRADLACDGGGAIWSGVSTTRAALVSATTERLGRAFDGRVGPIRDGILVGFSLGAFVALDVAQHSHGEWKRLLLIGAFVKPIAARLKKAGVESVLLASGDWDMSRDEMKRQAKALARQGIRARYVGMGPVGHRFAVNMDEWLARAIDWLEEEPEATISSAHE